MSLEVPEFFAGGGLLRAHCEKLFVFTTALIGETDSLCYDKVCALKDREYNYNSCSCHGCIKRL